MKLLTIIFVFIAAASEAQTRVSGIVTTANGDTIVGANIYIKGTFEGTTSGSNGSFSFTTVHLGEGQIIAAMLGFESFSTTVQLTGEPVTVHAVLKEKINELDAVTISAGSFETGDEKKMAVLNSIDIATTAGATADILGALKALPGVQPASESNGLFVRGGDAHETAVYFDGMPVNNLFTAQLPEIASRGRFSPFMFKGTSFTTGAYSAQFGNALSSTMSLESKDLPDKSKSDIGIMSAGVDATNAHRFKNSSLEFNAGYFNLAPVNSVVKQNATWIKSPEAINANAFYKLKTGSNGLMKVYLNYETESAGIRMDNAIDLTKLSDYMVKAHSLYINSTWQQYIKSRWRINAGLARGLDRNKAAIDEDDVLQDERSSHAHLSGTRYFGAFSNVKTGIDFSHFKSAESFNEREHSYKYDQVAVFSEANIYVNKNFAIRPGVRYDHTEPAGSVLSPRASLGWMINDLSQLSFGYGVFYQLPSKQFLYDTKDTEFENATHYVLNYQVGKEERMFRTEVYFKDYNNLLRIHQGNDINYSGYGYAKGIDLFYRDKKSIKYADFWITYSFLDTKRNYKNYPVLATPSFASKHVANLAGKYFIAAVSTSVGITYTYASGRHYLNPLSEKFLGDHTVDYHNVSLNISYLTSVGKQFTILYLSIENIFGINNIYGYRFSPDGSIRRPIVPAATRGIFAGMFITFGDDTYR